MVKNKFHVKGIKGKQQRAEVRVSALECPLFLRVLQLFFKILYILMLKSHLLKMFQTSFIHLKFTGSGNYLDY